MEIWWKSCVFSKRKFISASIDAEHKCRPLDDCVVNFQPKSASTLWTTFSSGWRGWHTQITSIILHVNPHSTFETSYRFRTSIELSAAIDTRRRTIMSNIVRFQNFTCQITNQINFSHPLVSYSAYEYVMRMCCLRWKIRYPLSLTNS